MTSVLSIVATDGLERPSFLGDGLHAAINFLKLHGMITGHQKGMRPSHLR